jgi:hypothetical protein
MRRSMFRLAGLMLAAALLGAACASQAAPTPGVVTTLLQDDFTQPTSGWDKYSGAEGQVGYDGGHYLIRVDQPQIYLWGTPGLNLADSTVDVEAAYVAGPLNNEFGLLCRFAKNNDKSSFYFFAISSDGYYVSGKVVQNKLTDLDPSDFKPSKAIQTGASARNHLTATCQGNHMTFAVNSTLLSTFTDDELKFGDVGLLAGTFDEAGVAIHFDALVVKKP